MIANSFHQLRPEATSTLLRQVAEKNQPKAVVEGNNDSLWQVVGMTIFVPLTVILTAPFVKPFRLSRILFTYLIPILPFITLLDGFLALFKLYAPAWTNWLSPPQQTIMPGPAENGQWKRRKDYVSVGISRSFKELKLGVIFHRKLFWNFLQRFS